jgi:hypothetical protein
VVGLLPELFIEVRPGGERHKQLCDLDQGAGHCSWQLKALAFSSGETYALSDKQSPRPELLLSSGFYSLLADSLCMHKDYLI